MSRRIVLWVGMGTLILVCVAIAFLVRVNSSKGGPVPPSPSAPTPPTQVQQTALIAVRADTGLIADAVTFGTETDVENQERVAASWLSMQPGLVVDVNTDGQVTVAERGPGAPSDTGEIIGNQLGFNLGDVIVLDRLAFAALVDAVNGVTVNVETSIVAVDADGTSEVLVRKGNQKLYGPAAADYVTTLNRGESPSERMSRYDDVLRQVVVKLPGDIDKARSVLGSLGSSSRTSGSVESIAQVLVAMRTALLDSTVTTGVPAADAGQVSGPSLYTLDPAENEAVMTELFAASLLVPGRNGAVPRVRVYAAGITYDATVAAQQALDENGQALVWGGQVKAAKTSEILISSAKLRAVALETATALGLSASLIEIDPSASPGVQVTVRLAPDSTLITPSPTATSTVSATPTP